MNTLNQLPDNCTLSHQEACDSAIKKATLRFIPLLA